MSHPRAVCDVRSDTRIMECPESQDSHDGISAEIIVRLVDRRRFIPCQRDGTPRRPHKQTPHRRRDEVRIVVQLVGYRRCQIIEPRAMIHTKRAGTTTNAHLPKSSSRGKRPHIAQASANEAAGVLQDIATRPYRRSAPTASDPNLR